MVMSDRIALLRSGELEQVATPREIYCRPATTYVAQFIGHTNLLTGDVRSGTVTCGAIAWRVSLPDGPATFSLRPENVRIASSSATPGMVRVRGRIVQQAFHGATELLRVQCSNDLTLMMRTGSGQNLQGEVEVEFSGADAIPVRNPPARS